MKKVFDTNDNYFRYIRKENNSHYYGLKMKIKKAFQIILLFILFK